eukprot:1158227-Pelagomonas_calceolata.AAC.7
MPDQITPKMCVDQACPTSEKLWVDKCNEWIGIHNLDPWGIGKPPNSISRGASLQNGEGVTWKSECMIQGVPWINAPVDQGHQCSSGSRISTMPAN